jgi:HlyD family secretion protein
MSKKSLLLSIVGVVLAVSGWLLYGGYGKAGDPPLKFETQAVDRGPLQAKVTATGTLSALVTVQVGSQVSGRIQQIFVDYNARVKKGQPVARIDPRLFEAAVNQARASKITADANLTKAKAEARNAARQLKRNQELVGRRLIPQSELDNSQTNVEIANAQVQVAEGALSQAAAMLQQAETNLAYTNIVSPTNGIVISRNVDVGQTVAASLQAPILFLIAEDLAKMQVHTNVAEADIGRIKPGMPAKFTVDAFAGEIFTGNVSQVRNAAQTVQNVVTYNAVVDVDNTDLRLRPGMTANVTFVYADKSEVLRVPNAALRFRPTPALLARLHQKPGDLTDPGQRAVWLLQDGEAQRRVIRIGISDGSHTELAGGDIKAGDALITEVIGGPPSDKPKPMTPPGGAGGFRRVF